MKEDTNLRVGALPEVSSHTPNGLSLIRDAARSADCEYEAPEETLEESSIDGAPGSSLQFK
jgi:hypothetical protein